MIALCVSILCWSIYDSGYTQLFLPLNAHHTQLFCRHNMPCIFFKSQERSRSIRPLPISYSTEQLVKRLHI